MKRIEYEIAKVSIITGTKPEKWKQPIVGYEFNEHLAIRQDFDPKQWIIDHRPSGYRIAGGFRTRKAAARACDALSAIPGAKWGELDGKKVIKSRRVKAALRKVLRP